MKIKLNMDCPVCGSKEGLKVYKYDENHVEQIAEISGQCLSCPLEYHFTIKGPENKERLKKLVFSEE